MGETRLGEYDKQNWKRGRIKRGEIKLEKIGI